MHQGQSPLLRNTILSIFVLAASLLTGVCLDRIQDTVFHLIQEAHGAIVVSMLVHADSAEWEMLDQQWGHSHLHNVIVITLVIENSLSSQCYFKGSVMVKSM